MTSREQKILMILRDAGCEMYGTDILERYPRGPISRWLGMGSGWLYSTLLRLEDGGFIESRPDNQNPLPGGLRRRLYKATGRRIPERRAGTLGYDPAVVGATLPG